MLSFPKLLKDPFLSTILAQNCNAIHLYATRTHLPLRPFKQLNARLFRNQPQPHQRNNQTIVLIPVKGKGIYTCSES